MDAMIYGKILSVRNTPDTCVILVKNHVEHAKVLFTNLISKIYEIFLYHYILLHFYWYYIYFSFSLALIVDSSECKGKECGELCSEGICDGDGFCTSPEFNPCSVHGCSGKHCGDNCLSGDLAGICNKDGECIFDIDSVILSGECG